MKHTAKQLKAKAPFFWQAVEDKMFEYCNQRRVAEMVVGGKTQFICISDTTCRRIAEQAASIATSEFVSRSKR